MKTNCIMYVTEAHQLALPNFVANTKSVFNPDAKETGGECTVILSKGANYYKYGTVSNYTTMRPATQTAQRGRGRGQHRLQ